MTIAQTARLEGFRASVEVRGVLLSIGGETFDALVDPLRSEEGEFRVATREREASRIMVARDDLPDAVVIDSVLLTEDEEHAHRVKEIHDHPTDVLVELIAETAPVP